MDIYVEKTHYLPRLLELCKGADPAFDELKNAAAELTDYAVAGRYPDDWSEIPLDEASEATKRAEEIMAFVRGKLTLQGGPE